MISFETKILIILPSGIFINHRRDKSTSAANTFIAAARKGAALMNRANTDLYYWILKKINTHILLFRLHNAK